MGRAPEIRLDYKSGMRRCAMHAAWLVLIGSLAAAGCSGPATRHPGRISTIHARARASAPSDIEGIDVVVHCDRDIPSSGYSAQTDSGVPLDSPYARERGVDQGLITLRDSRQRTAAFVVAAERIRSAIEIRTDADVYDKMDLLLMTDGDLIVVHTFATDAGIFTASDVWQLPATPSRLSSMPEPIRQLTRHGLDVCGFGASGG